MRAASSVVTAPSLSLPPSPSHPHKHAYSCVQALVCVCINTMNILYAYTNSKRGRMVGNEEGREEWKLINDKRMDAQKYPHTYIYISKERQHTYTTYKYPHSHTSIIYISYVHFLHPAQYVGYIHIPLTHTHTDCNHCEPCRYKPQPRLINTRSARWDMMSWC